MINKKVTNRQLKHTDPQVLTIPLVGTAARSSAQGLATWRIRRVLQGGPSARSESAPHGLRQRGVRRAGPAAPRARLQPRRRTAIDRCDACQYALGPA